MKHIVFFLVIQVLGIFCTQALTAQEPVSNATQKPLRVGITSSYSEQLLVIFRNIYKTDVVELGDIAHYKKYFAPNHANIYTTKEALAVKTDGTLVTYDKHRVRGLDYEWSGAEPALLEKVNDQFRQAAKKGIAPIHLDLSAFIDVKAVQAEVATLQAIVLPGGEDVNPFLYLTAWPAKVTYDEPYVARDILELAVLQAAFAQKKPILAICRGAQILAVTLGHTLIPDIDLRYGSGSIHKPKTPYGQMVGGVVVTNEEGAQLFDASVFTIGENHHQSVLISKDDQKIPLRAIAWSMDTGTKEKTGVVEAFVTKGAIGVQFHIERPRILPELNPPVTITDPRYLLKDSVQKSVFDRFFDCILGKNKTPSSWCPV